MAKKKSVSKGKQVKVKVMVGKKTQVYTAKDIAKMFDVDEGLAEKKLKEFAIDDENVKLSDFNKKLVKALNSSPLKERD